MTLFLGQILIFVAVLALMFALDRAFPSPLNRARKARLLADELRLAQDTWLKTVRVEALREATFACSIIFRRTLDYKYGPGSEGAQEAAMACREAVEKLLLKEERT